MQVHFDWFDVPKEMRVAAVCRRKAVNLVIKFHNKKMKD
jgi:hypothetical protein